MGASYSFVSRWEVPATPQRCWAQLQRMLSPGVESWWPGMAIVEAPTEVAAGRSLTLAVRSPLGYRLRTRLTITDVDPGRSLSAASAGDLRGTGSVEVRTAGEAASVVVFHWDVTTERAWMNATARVLRPVFERAHAAVMRAGERGLTARLASGDRSG
ncbi:hypothetical protein [Microbacterium ulmi]|uniref:Polyketide cyclase / dehydrase and lipid transport n=1 Tax=Microbacterium ulmi TaxID=179095 RepID=A0A7Y2LY03_9MICO|nr:hypothetical protein [Microbacterium ulmi]NII70880.1 hypothetical protein [Microbacterium ulmi]NNH02894.1 hypothetical protein [Microbacterium ulmi]